MSYDFDLIHNTLTALQRHSIDCRCPECDIRKRMRHEQQDEGKPERWSNIDEQSGLPKQGEL